SWPRPTSCKARSIRSAAGRRPDAVVFGQRSLHARDTKSSRPAPNVAQPIACREESPMDRSYRLATLVFAVALAMTATAQPSRADDAFEFVALGDMPYKLPDDYKRFETLIAAINKVKPVFSIHVGDIKSGSTLCSDELIEKVHGYFKTFQQPLIYTPGDNEWTDCHREKAGKYNPLEWLAFVRKLFFSDDKSQ